jgi:nucleoside-diphosphate-sugar epimerase
MFKTAIAEREIIVNNPAIWRPILSIQDAVSAYIRSVEVDYDISGIFNIASGNYTVGEIADIVLDVVGEKLNKKIKLTIKHLQDFRNYKVSIEKAENVLSFKPRHDAAFIVEDLIKNMERFLDFENPNYYNIQVFKSLMSEREK